MKGVFIVVLAVVAVASVSARQCLTVDGVSLVKSFESFRAEQTRDVSNVWTIGYGTLCTSGALRCPGPIAEREAAEELGRMVASSYGTCVREYVKAPLNANQYSALISFAFNAGCGSLRDVVSSASGVVHRFPKFMAKYNKAHVNNRFVIEQDLVNRRTKEIALFRSRQWAPCATQNGKPLSDTPPHAIAGKAFVPGHPVVSLARAWEQRDVNEAATPFPVHPPISFADPLLAPHTQGRVFAEGVDTGRVQWIGPRHVHRRMDLGGLKKHRKHKKGVKKADGKENGVRRHNL